MKKCKRYPAPRTYFVSTIRDNAPSQWDAATPQIEDHLDRVFAPLVDTLPYARRSQLKAEMRDRLRLLTTEYIAAGEAPEQAVKKAIEGADPTMPEQIEKSPNGWRSRLIFGDENVPIPSARNATYTAAAWLGVATLLLILLNQAPGDLNFNFWTALGFPLIVGFATSMRSRQKPALGTFYATLAMTPIAFVAQALFAPQAADATALLYLVLWLPVGCLAAWAGAKLRPGILSALRRHSEPAIPLQ